MDENNKKKRTFRDLWADKQMHAIIVLGMWFCFFISIFLVLGIISMFSSPTKEVKDEEKIEEKVAANIPKMLENLNESNYNFEIIITDGDNKYTYNGTKENEEIKGYYESSLGIIKYTIKDNIYYQLDGDNLVENENIITEENKNIIDINNILEEIKTYEIDNEVVLKDNIYIYELPENKEISILTNNNEISKIDIEFNNNVYNLTFKNINE